MSLNGVTGFMGNDAHFSAPSEKCPYSTFYLEIAEHSNAAYLPVTKTMFTGLLGHSAVVAQTESMWRISRDCSRQKRGPPSNTPSK